MEERPHRLRGREGQAIKPGPDTVVRDLEGKALLPAFIDAHSHFINAPPLKTGQRREPAGRTAVDIPSTIETAAEVPGREEDPERRVGSSAGATTATVSPGPHITRRISTRHSPIYKVMLMHVSLHGAVLNSKALRWAGVGAPARRPFGRRDRAHARQARRPVC